MPCLHNKLSGGLCVLIFLVLLPVTAGAFRYNSTAGYAASRPFSREYVLVLFAIPLPFPEIVDLAFSDNGTFTLQSDIFTEPADGTYNKKIFLAWRTITPGRFPPFVLDIASFFLTFFYVHSAVTSSV